MRFLTAYVLLSILTLAVLFAVPAKAIEQEQDVKLMASAPATTDRLLSAPHTGSTICDLPDRTLVRFLKRANHGPHKFAKVEVLAGDCVGNQGFVPWLSLDPKPQIE